MHSLLGSILDELHLCIILFLFIVDRGMFYVCKIMAGEGPYTDIHTRKNEFLNGKSVFREIRAKN